MVHLHGKPVLIDKTGAAVLSMEYDFAHYLTDGLVRVSLNNGAGIIDMAGKVVAPLGQYDGFSPFSEGLGRVRQNGKWGYIDKTGQQIVPCIYDTGDYFSDGFARVCLNGKWGYIALHDAQPGTNTSTSGIGVTVDGKAVQWTDAVPFIDANSRTMVPLRAVGDALGLAVDWDGNKREAIFTNGRKTIYFPIDKSTARTSDASTIVMDTAAVVIDGRTYAPIRYLAEYFGRTVDWDGASQTVIIK